VKGPALPVCDMPCPPNVMLPAGVVCSRGISLPVTAGLCCAMTPALPLPATAVIGMFERT
jgi:hypothetical protein